MSQLPQTVVRVMTNEQRKRAIALQDAIGALIDNCLRDGMAPGVVREVLSSEATALEGRQG